MVEGKYWPIQTPPKKKRKKFITQDIWWVLSIWLSCVLINVFFFLFFFLVGWDYKSKWNKFKATSSIYLIWVRNMIVRRSSEKEEKKWEFANGWHWEWGGWGPSSKRDWWLEVQEEEEEEELCVFFFLLRINLHHFNSAPPPHQLWFAKCVFCSFFKKKN